MSRKEIKFESDYAYPDLETDEIKCVHLEVTVVNDKIQLVVVSDEELDRLQMEEILNNIQEATFNKLAISIAKDCNIIMVVGESRYTVFVSENAIRVKDIRML